MAERKYIDLSFETQIENGIAVNIDREKCRQIVQNLLSNAFRFTPANGQIRVNLSMHGDLLELQVADTGPGIHPDDLPNVFDRFFQTNRPDSPAEGGTGIGLALCREYAELFGGKIEADSTLGKGSVFQLIFPIMMAENIEAAVVHPQPLIQGVTLPDELMKKKAAPPKMPGDQRPAILVVEDNLDLQDYIRLILQDTYNVFTAENGRAALEFMGSMEVEKDNSIQHPASSIQHPVSSIENFPDLIISDLMMPVMDGYQLLEKLKSSQTTGQIPVIMLTARAEQPDKLKALRIGVDDYLTKPFNEEELKVRINNLLTNYVVRREVVAETEQKTNAPNIKG